ncbi:GNAT family N-acetyltransferase, partial [Streptomyces sp. NPDC057271]|uniref:GNAT family N-acetyltransferase n=1 Tax=Streptomyces sp. NPDC057271 TaxID=3346078 RepID=UPI003626FC75
MSAPLTPPPVTGAPAAPTPSIELLDPSTIRVLASEGLAALLVDAVDGGASLGFLAPLDPAEAASWWQTVAEEAERGARDVWAARGPAGEVLGAVTLVRTEKPNGRHRGEIARLIVHREARGQGLGGRLLAAAEAHAARAGRTLLILSLLPISPPTRP